MEISDANLHLCRLELLRCDSFDPLRSFPQIGELILLIRSFLFLKHSFLFLIHSFLYIQFDDTMDTLSEEVEFNRLTNGDGPGHGSISSRISSTSFSVDQKEAAGSSSRKSQRSSLRSETKLLQDLTSKQAFE